MYQDKTLTCRECGAEFVFSASEQAFYAEKGFQNEPGRCPSCRSVRRNSGSTNRSDRQMYEVVCDSCGVTTQVPFQPRGDRPVLCRDCYDRQRQLNRY
ncbi:zinc-binding protein [Clostridia bacterium]|nr:zinc-binding protein [Clostridia bacterium]